MRKTILATFLGLAMTNSFAQLPDFYQEVDRITWVVDDLSQVIQGWNRLGFRDFQEYGEMDLGLTEYRGQPVRVRGRVALGKLGSAHVTLVEPIGDAAVYSDFLKRKGSGIFALLHRVPTLAALSAEIKRLESRAVSVLARGAVPTAAGEVQYVYFDTETEGKYVIGLAYYPEDSMIDRTPAGPPHLRLSQYAFVVSDLDTVSRYWHKLGFPEMSVTHGGLRDLKYRDQPGQFDQKLGWQRHGKIVYEWILPVKGPTVYDEHLKIHGEGFHHLAFDVDDIDRVNAEWSQIGFPIVQAGAWGDEGKPGSGRFAYADTTGIGGISIEFLWNFKPNELTK
jgi:methylmalonyl-CoA/ethylmalonyl-CoA epimerase